MKKRIMSVILTASVMVSGLYVSVFGAVADTVNKEYDVERQKVNAEWLEEHSDNLLTDSFCNLKSEVGGYRNIQKINVGSKSDLLTFISDGDLDTKFDLWSDKWVYITYNIGSEMPIKSFMLAGLEGNSSSAPREFEIYVGDSEDKDVLFADENKKISYSRSSADNSVTSWVFNFKDGNSPKGSCIGFLIKKGDANNHLQFAEIGAYADTSAMGYSVKSEAVDESWLNENNSENLLSAAEGLSITAESAMEGFSNVSETKGGEYLTALTDGNKKTRYEKWIDNDAVYSPICFTFDIGSKQKINQFAVSGYADGKNAPQEFEIYASSSKDDLYNASNRIIYFKNTDKHMAYTDQKHRSNWLFKLVDGASAEAQYVGFKILVPNEANAKSKNAIFIEELGVFADKFKPTYTYDADGNTVTREWVAANHENNLIRFAECTVTNEEGSLTNSKGQKYSIEDTSKLTDGNAYDPEGSTDCGKSAYNLWLVENVYETINYTYDMMQNVPIDKIMLASYYNPGMDHCVRYYAVYVSDNKEDLYNKENQVIYWDNTGKYKKQSPTYEGGHEVFTFTGSKKPSGRYVGFSIIKNTAQGYPCVRLQQLGVYTDGVKPYNPNLTPAYTYETIEDAVNQEWVTEHHDKNLISQAECNMTDIDGNAADTRKGNALSKLTDGIVFVGGKENNSQYAYWASEPAVYRYTYDMKQSVTVDTVMFAGDYNKSVNIAPSKYAVYISDSLDDLYNPENAAIVRDNTGKYKKDSAVYAGATQIYNFTGEKPKGRYVGFSIIKGQPDGSGYIRMQQLGVYSNGVLPKSQYIDDIPAGEYGKYPYTLSRDTVTPEYVTEHMTENLIRYSHPSVTGDGYAKLADGIDADFVGLTNGKICESGSGYSAWFTEWQTTCYTFNIGYSAPIDRLMLISQYFPHGDYATREYEFYIGEDRDTLYDIENRVVYYNNEGRYVKWDEVHRYGTKQLFEFTGDQRPVGKYVGLRIIQPGSAETSNIGTNEFFGCGIRIDELAVYSDGNMPLDALYSQTLEDTVSGITALVRKLDFDDSFKLGEFSAREIAVSPEVSDYNLKHGLVAAGKAYRVIFKDALGNELSEEDLDGRKIELRIPCSLTNSGNDTYVCQYINGAYKNLSGYFGGNTLVVLMEAPGDIYIVSDVFKQNYDNVISFDWDPIKELSEGLIQIDDSPDEITVTDTVYVDGNSGTDSSKTEKPAKKTYKKIVRRIAKNGTDSGFPVWAVVSIVAGCVAAVGGIGTVTIIKLKKKKSEGRL